MHSHFREQNSSCTAHSFPCKPVCSSSSSRTKPSKSRSLSSTAKSKKTTSPSLLAVRWRYLSNLVSSADSYLTPGNGHMQFLQSAIAYHPFQSFQHRMRNPWLQTHCPIHHRDRRYRSVLLMARRDQYFRFSARAKFSRSITNPTNLLPVHAPRPPALPEITTSHTCNRTKRPIQSVDSNTFLRRSSEHPFWLWFAFMGSDMEVWKRPNSAHYIKKTWAYKP